MAIKKLLCAKNILTWALSLVLLGCFLLLITFKFYLISDMYYLVGDGVWQRETIYFPISLIKVTDLDFSTTVWGKYLLDNNYTIPEASVDATLYFAGCILTLVSALLFLVLPLLKPSKLRGSFYIISYALIIAAIVFVFVGLDKIIHWDGLGYNKSSYGFQLSTSLTDGSQHRVFDLLFDVFTGKNGFYLEPYGHNWLFLSPLTPLLGRIMLFIIPLLLFFPAMIIRTTRKRPLSDSNQEA